ncbi:hypothetical protein [Salininema proteolyticum]|uniref:SH3 domain-containing protein n=1 Tax=Salininema proteolyticum TaxID=1607685 RepID=A0ABV8TTM5_9ACTN
MKKTLRAAVLPIIAMIALAFAAPAQAAPEQEPEFLEASTAAGPNEAAAAAWYPTRAWGNSPIRECYLATCDVVWRTFDGARLEWSHWARNQHGNKWYYVRYGSYNGWIYCGNLDTGC